MIAATTMITAISWTTKSIASVPGVKISGKIESIVPADPVWFTTSYLADNMNKNKSLRATG
jgi:hypothetical protein